MNNEDGLKNIDIAASAGRELIDGLGDLAEAGLEAGLDKYEKKKNPLPADNISSESKIPRANLINRVTDAVKGAGQRLKDNVMGTEEQNKAAQERMDKAKTKKMAKGGSVSSASKRADGCAIRGKTRA
jgi:hypothetical protein